MNTKSSDPFLTSTYSTEMQDYFNYFLDEEAKAHLLLVDALYRAKAPMRWLYLDRRGFQGRSARKPAPAMSSSGIRRPCRIHGGRDAAEYQIPPFMVIDSRSGLAWSHSSRP